MRLINLYGNENADTKSVLDEICKEKQLRNHQISKD